MARKAGNKQKGRRKRARSRPEARPRRVGRLSAVLAGVLILVAAGLGAKMYLGGGATAPSLPAKEADGRVLVREFSDYG